MKKESTFLALAFVLISTVAFAGGPSVELYGGGLTIGSILAVYLSWKRNESVIWAIIHFLLGWIYVIYNLLTKK